MNIVPDKDNSMFSNKSSQESKDTLTGDFLSMGLIMNFLSLKEIFLISLHGKPILGVNLKEHNDKQTIKLQ